MKRAITCIVLIMSLLTVSLAGCGKNRETDILRQEAQAINESSTLPMALLTSNEKANPAAFEETIANYTSFDYYGKDYVLCFCGFPTDEDSYFLTEITWTGEQYDLFGVRVGDDPAKAMETIQAQGYTLIDGGYMADFEKNGVTLRLTGDTMVKEIMIHIPTQFTSGNLY